MKGDVVEPDHGVSTNGGDDVDADAAARAESTPIRTPTSAHVGGRAGRRDPTRHVHLVMLGLMGSGKTTVGHLVANEVGRPFVDSDSIVALRSGRSPRELADEEGPGELHRVELTAARHVLGLTDAVVFAAAASVVDGLTASDLGSSWTVWLDTSPAVLADRVEADRRRPLLGSDPGHVLERQHEERAARGRALADVSVSTDRRSPHEIALAVCDAWRELLRATPDADASGIDVDPAPGGSTES